MSFWLWLVYALLTPFFWAINNVLDRMMITRLNTNEYVLSFAAALTRLPFLFVFLWLADWYVPHARELILALIAGFLVVLPLVFYYKALEKDEAPPVILIYDATNPIFVLILSTLFLHERLNVFEGFGFGFLLLAGVLASLKFEEKIRISRGAWWIILAALFWAPADVLLGYLVHEFPSASALLAYEFIGSFLGGFLFFLVPQFRKHCRAADFHWSKTLILVYGIATFIAYAGYFTFLKAFALERVSLTVVVTNIQPLLVFFFGLILASFSRLFEKPDTSFRNLFPKGISLLFILLGIWLLQK